LFNYMQYKHPAENFAMILVSESRRTMKMSSVPIYKKMFLTSPMFIVSAISFFIVLIHYLNALM
jgi:hypothetical protein